MSKFTHRGTDTMRMRGRHISAKAMGLGLALLLSACIASTGWAGTASAPPGVTVKDEGTSIGTKTEVNFTGSSVTCTSVSVPAAECAMGQGGHVIESPPGTPLTQRPNLTFGLGVSCTDDAVDNETDCFASSVPPANVYVKGHRYDAVERMMNTDPYVFTEYVPTLFRMSKFGGALMFDGNNDYATDTSPQITVFTGWTASVWIYRTTTGVISEIFSVGDGTTANTATLAVRILSTDKLDGLAFAGASFSRCTGSTGLLVNRWYHLAVTFNNSTNTLTCYVNGVQDGATGAGDSFASNTSATVDPTVASAGGVRIGTHYSAAPPTQVFGGLIDEPAYYNTIKTSAEISAMYNAGVGAACAAGGGLVECWKFDEMGGTTGTATITTPGNDVTLSNVTSPANMVSGWQPKSAWEGTTKKLGAYAAAFDGKNDYLEIRGANIFPSGSSARTIEAWVYPQSSTIQGTIFSYGDPATANQLLEVGINGWVAADNGKVVVYTNGNAVKSATSLTLNAWNWVAVTLDGTGTTLATATAIYINSTAADCSPSGTACAAAGSLGTAGTIATATSGAVDAFIGRRGGDQVDCLPLLDGCLRFDGTDDEVTVPDHADLDPVDMTVMVWVKPSTCTGDQHPISKSSTNSSWRIMIVNNNCRVDFVAGGQTIFSSFNIVPMTWNHLVFVGKSGAGGFVRAYINGQYAGGTQTAYVRVDTTELVRIGGGPTGLETLDFNGWIDEARVYKEAVTLSEILQAYNVGRARQCRGDQSTDETNLVACWPLNDRTGTTATDIESVLAGGPHNGTLANIATPPTYTSGWVASSTFPGIIDELAVWNIALTGASTPTLATRYNAGSGAELVGTETNLAAVWHMNDGPGSFMGVVYSQEKVPSSAGSDANNCTSPSTPCLKIAAAQNKVAGDFSGNVVIHLASGVYTESVATVGYQPVGNSTITFRGYYNSTPNSLTNAATNSGTATSATASFPGDTRSLLSDTDIAAPFGQHRGHVLHLTSGAGVCSDDYNNWHRIEQTWDAVFNEAISVVGSWLTCGTPSSTTTYEVFNDQHGAIVQGALTLPPGTEAAATWLVKDSSGISLERVLIRGGEPGLKVLHSSVDRLLAMGTEANGYGTETVLGSVVQRVLAQRDGPNHGYSGFRNAELSNVKLYRGGMTYGNAAVGLENFQEGAYGAIVESLALHNRWYAGFDLEFSPIVTYNFSSNRGAGNKYGVLVAHAQVVGQRQTVMNDNYTFGYYITSGAAYGIEPTAFNLATSLWEGSRNGSYGVFQSGGFCDCNGFTLTDNGGVTTTATLDYKMVGAQDPELVGTITLVNGNNNHDIDILNYETVKVSGPTAAYGISGFKRGFEGRTLIVWSDIAQTATIQHATGSVSGNQIVTNTGANLTSTGTFTMRVQYLNSAWRIVSWSP